MLLIDAGGFSWTMCAKMKHVAAKPIWEHVDRLCQGGARFCVDSHLSIRKQHLPFYKAQRLDEPPTSANLRACAWEFIKKLMKNWPKNYVIWEGLEADDLIALDETEGDIIMSSDKDMLTLGSHTNLVDQNMMSWDHTRIKTKLPIAKGARWVAYQLMYGDVADNIPRLLLSKDIYTAKIIMAQPNPLEIAIHMLPPDLVRDQLRCICLPTPLFAAPKEDPIDWALNHYKV